MTLPRDEDSALRHWSARLIQALQILDLEVDHEAIVQVADESRKAVGPHADAISAFIVGYAAGTASTDGRKSTQDAVHAAVEQGHRAVRARRIRRPRRKGLGQAGPVAPGQSCTPHWLAPPAGHALPCGRKDGHVGIMSSGRGQGWACPAG